MALTLHFKNACENYVKSTEQFIWAFLRTTKFQFTNVKN